MTPPKRFAVLPALLLVVTLLAACGSESGNEATSPTTETTLEVATPAAPNKVSITARDYAFDVPATFAGGLTELSYSNAGKEPHFAAFAQIAPGKTFADVKAALLAPSDGPAPSGPPPFEDVAGFPAADGGVKGSMTFNMPSGSYAFYCLIPSPDGVTHAAKGMITEVTVTDGPQGALPEAEATVQTVDFGFDSLPSLSAGSHVVRLRNQGKQLHEIGLVELPAGRTMDQVVAWFKEEEGPPPMRFLSGVAVKPGTEGNTTLNLEAGKTYAFVCAIPDFLGDFTPHVVKGMRTSAFTVA